MTDVSANSDNPPRHRSRPGSYPPPFEMTLAEPSIGLRYEWGSSLLLPSKTGTMTWFWLTISGREALSWGFLDAAVKTLGQVGVVTEAKAHDCEDGPRFSPCKQDLPHCGIGDQKANRLLLAAIAAA